MKTQKDLWLERKSWLVPMLENVEDALDTINKAEQLNSEALEAIVGLNELAHDQYLTLLRGIHNKPMVSKAKPISVVELAEMVYGKSQNPHYNFPKD